MSKQRDSWVDLVKLVACILVVLGHFFQSVVKAGIIQDSLLYEWFNTTIYYFHVPLFFICSGYLFQKYSKVRSVSSWRNNVLKKLLALGIPYLVFSILTWVLKIVFSSSVNEHVDGLLKSLLVSPLSPYWYLYVLFIFFVVAFTVTKKQEMIILLAIACILKLWNAFEIYTGIYAVDKTMDFYIWFVFGMAMGFGAIKYFDTKIGIIAAIILLVLSIVPFAWNLNIVGFSTVVGLIACYSVISIIRGTCSENNNRILGWLSQYTMPIFLMHTLFAAPFRSLLIKIGISNAAVHVVGGIAISFMGPVIAMIIMEKLRPLDFLVYPRRYIK